MPASKQRTSFRVRVGEREHQVEVTIEDGERRVVVDGEPYEVESAGANVHRVSPGEAGGGRQVEVTLGDGPRAREGAVGGIRAQLVVQTEQEAQLAESLGKRGGGVGSGSLTAPMPGRVVKILVTAGEQVEQGAPAVIVEAMKMENELHAPATGEVTRVEVAEGDTVDAGQILVQIAVAEDSA